MASWSAHPKSILQTCFLLHAIDSFYILFCRHFDKVSAPSAPALTCCVIEAVSAKLGHGVTFMASVSTSRKIYKIGQKKPGLCATVRLNVHVLTRCITPWNHSCPNIAHFNQPNSTEIQDKTQQAGPIYKPYPCETPTVHQCSYTCDIVITPEVHFNVIPLQHHAVLHAGLCNSYKHIIL